MQSYRYTIPSIFSNCRLYSCIRFIWTSNIASKLTWSQDKTTITINSVRSRVKQIAESRKPMHHNSQCSQTLTPVKVSMYSASLILLIFFTYASYLSQIIVKRANLSSLIKKYVYRVVNGSTILHSCCRTESDACSRKPAKSSTLRIHASVPSHFEIRELKLGLLTTIHLLCKHTRNVKWPCKRIT